MLRPDGGQWSNNRFEKEVTPRRTMGNPKDGITQW